MEKAPVMNDLRYWVEAQVRNKQNLYLTFQYVMLPMGAFPVGQQSRICLQCRRHGDPASIPGLGRSLGEGNGYPLQYSCLENLMDRGAWPATIHWVTESDTTERLTLTLLSLQHTLSPEKSWKVPPKSYAQASLRKFEMQGQTTPSNVHSTGQNRPQGQTVFKNK